MLLSLQFDGWRCSICLFCLVKCYVKWLSTKVMPRKYLHILLCFLFRRTTYDLLKETYGFCLSWKARVQFATPQNLPPFLPRTRRSLQWLDKIVSYIYIYIHNLLYTYYNVSVKGVQLITFLYTWLRHWHLPIPKLVDIWTWYFLCFNLFVLIWFNMKLKKIKKVFGFKVSFKFVISNM